MPAVGSYRSVLLLLSVVPSSVLGATVRAKSCPLANCHNDNNVDASSKFSLLELSSERSTTASKARGCGNTFLPAHFTCSSCDVQTCKGCNNVICDVTKCIGKFYTQECWCTKPLNPKVDKFFCDSDCTGGLCNTQGLTCKTRETACKPWWWCKLPPPKEPDSFLQKMSSTRQGQGACATTQESSKRLNERFERSKAQLTTVSALKEKSRGPKKQIAAFDFEPGEFVCESALLPQPDVDPVTLAESFAGFIVLDGTTCSGGFFKHKCFCYDKFLYLRGEDAKVTELDCDKGCGQGPCGGKTCGKQAPPPLPAPTPAPPIDPLLQELANEGQLRNYGTQMSPTD